MFFFQKIRTTTAVAALLAATVWLLAFLPTGNDSTTPDKVKTYYAKRLNDLEQSVALFERMAPTASPDSLRHLFAQCRVAYKHIEFLVEYHFAASAQKLNGPALPESEPSEPAEPQHPSGFQVLEEVVYADWQEATRKDISFELSTIHNRINRLQALLPDLELTESNVLEAVRLNLFRLITKGITGFDSPIALHSLPEAVATLQASRQTLGYFPSAMPVVNSINRSIAYLQQHTRFDTFNRAVFIAQYLNPACVALHRYQLARHIAFPQPQRGAVRFAAATLFEEGAFDPLFYAPSGATAATAAQVAIGKKLFRDPLLSANGLRSCANCHVPEKAFADGLATNEALSGNQKLLRNTPTLLNAALQPVQFYDSHIAFLEDQAHDVISNRTEMGGLFEVITEKLSKEKTYRVAFAAAYPGQTISSQHVKTALAAYVRSLVGLSSPFDRYMRGDAAAMSREAINGFNLFAGKAKCATCHFMPLFSGTVPPLYDKMESEVLGIPATPDTLHPVLDNDSGKYHLYHIPHQLYAFKTTSVRNVGLTAPYMHNGVYQTLEEVVDFYNRGGGAGLGFELPNQTLPPDKLNLTPVEKKQLIAFLRALTNEK